VTLRVEGSNRRFYVQERSDLVVLEEVIAGDAYGAARELSSPEVIVDLGGNIGCSVLFFHSIHPQARIYVCEPDPRAFKLLQANVGDLPGVRLVQIAISDHDGTARFGAASETFASGLTAEGDLEVPTERLDTLLRRVEEDRIDLLKIDVEGAEYAALAAYDDLAHVQQIQGEVHLDLMEVDRQRFFSLFRAFEVEVMDHWGGPQAPDAERYTFVARRSAPGVAT
jgi:FkbM family methyltransferase